jgi:hypothetical protein
MALHVLAEGFQRLFQNFPGRLRGLDVAPLVTARTCIKVVIIQRPYFIFNLRRDLLVLHFLQQRSCGLLGFARKLGMYFQQTSQNQRSLIRLQTLQRATDPAVPR